MLRRLATVLAPLLLTACMSLPSTDVDRELGAKTVKQVEQDIGLLDDKALNAYLERVGQRLVSVLPQRQFSYQFTVVDQVDPNAFAVPGGHVYVSRGLLMLLQSEDELAGVLAHEIQHVEQRHSIRQMRKELGLGLLALPGKLVGGIISDDVAALAGKPFEAVAAGYSRDQEREADTLGQPLAAAAGYNPRAMADILNRMERFIGTVTTDKRAPSFFDNHPTTPERVSTLMRLAGTITPAAPAPVAANNTVFIRQLDGLLVGQDPAEGVVRDEAFLHPDLGFRITFPKGWLVENSRNSVASMSPDKKSYAVFGMATKGGAAELPKIAADFSQKLEKKYGTKAQQVEGTTPSGLPTRAVAVTDTSSAEHTHLNIQWVALGGNVYQMIGIAPGAQRSPVKSVADSLRPLTPAERATITELRLRVTTARPGEDLAALSARNQGVLPAPALAAMNGLPEGARFQGGEIVKVAVRGPHKSSR